MSTEGEREKGKERRGEGEKRGDPEPSRKNTSHITDILIYSTRNPAPTHTHSHKKGLFLTVPIILRRESHVLGMVLLYPPPPPLAECWFGTTRIKV